jgi:hypothetical protein
MKKIVYFLVAALLFNSASAQVKDSVLEQYMSQRMYDCYEVEYNSILVLPGLYRNGKKDTMTALINFWKKHCPPSERIFSIDVLNAIGNGTFREHVNGSEFLTHRAKATLNDSDIYLPKILYYLQEYKAATKGSFSDNQYSIWLNRNYPLPKDYSEYYSFYKVYYVFLKEMAKSMIGKRQYTPVEDFLLRFYANPDSVSYSELDSAAFTGSVLRGKYESYKKYHHDVHGVSSAIQTGMWIPNGNLAILGNHPYLVYNIGARSENLIVEYTFGVRFSKSAASYNVRKDDSVYSSDNFLGWYTGVDFGLKLFRTRKSEMDILWGVGYEEAQTLFVTLKNNKPSGADESISQSVKSFYANAGLGYRFYIRDVVLKNKHKRSYLSLQAKYNYMNYRNVGGTDLGGNAITVGLAYGIYSHEYTRHPYLR